MGVQHQHTLHHITNTRVLSLTLTNTHGTYEAVEHGAGDAVDPAHGERGQGSVAPETHTRGSSTIGKTILPSPAALKPFSSLSHTPAKQTHPSRTSLSPHTRTLLGQESKQGAIK